MPATQWLTSRQACERLGVRPQTLYAYVSRGLLTPQKTGRESRYDPEEVEALAQRALNGQHADLPDHSFNTVEGKPASADGRVAHGQWTQRKTAEALVALLEEGDPSPTVRDIAARAGVSVRTVFHHFENMEDLYRTAGNLQLQRYWRKPLKFAPDLPRQKRVELVVRSRAELYEGISSVRRAAARRADSDPVLSQLLVQSNRVLRSALASTFQAELGSMDPTEADVVLDALDCLTSWEAWDRMRQIRALSLAASRRTMLGTVSLVLSTVP